MSKNKFRPKVANFLAECEDSATEISIDRKQRLMTLAEYIYSKSKAAKPAKLIFICTHNSRRSQMAELAAKSAAIHYGLNNVESYSGGTEATAFNPNAINAIQIAGYEVEKLTLGDNPSYKIAISKTASDTFFSKVYDGEPNPAKGYASIMVCSDAERDCPYVGGAEQRIALTYEDPKRYDNSTDTERAYLRTFYEITIEMMFAFNKASRK